MTSSSSSALLKAYIPAMANSSLIDRNKGNPMHIDLVISGGTIQWSLCIRSDNVPT